MPSGSIAGGRNRWRRHNARRSPPIRRDCTPPNRSGSLPVRGGLGMDATIGFALRPPVPPPPDVTLSLRGYLQAARRNVIGLWPDQAYEQDCHVQQVLHRRSVLLNAPDAIHHVLVDNPGNYRRTPSAVRALRPITGNGLLLSE